MGLELVSDLRELAVSSGAVELEGPIKNLLARCEALGLDQSKDSCEKLVEHVQVLGPPEWFEVCELITSVRATCLASGSRRSWAIAESSMARQSHGRKCAPFATWSKRAGCAT